MKNGRNNGRRGIASQQFNTNTDDIGFMINTSFGNGYRITGNSAYQSVLLQAAHSLTNRYNSIVRCLADDLLLAADKLSSHH